MISFVALLRGVNVSGQKLIKMTELKKLFEEQGYHNVQTYIQSGNVVFSSTERSSDKIKNILSKSIKQRFGFDVGILVITTDIIEHVLSNNPFIKKNKETNKLYVTFLLKHPSTDNIKKLNSTDYSPEEYLIDGKLVYLHLPNGYGKTRLSNNLFENKLKVEATTRNWRTITKLWELSSKS